MDIPYLLDDIISVFYANVRMLVCHRKLRGGVVRFYGMCIILFGCDKSKWDEPTIHFLNFFSTFRVFVFMLDSLFFLWTQVLCSGSLLSIFFLRSTGMS